MKFTLSTLFLFLALVASGCTVFDEDQRRTLNWLDDSLTPSNATARNLLLPVAVPVGVVGLASDMIVVNPIMAIDDAWADTVDLLWTRDEDTSNLRRVLVAPITAIATPVVFVSDWFGRCLFPIDPREEEE